MSKSASGFDQRPLDLESLGNLIERHQNTWAKRSIVATSRITLAVLIAVTTALFYFRSPFQPMSTIPSSTSNPLSGWHTRLHSFEGDFNPSREALAFTQLFNSKVEPEGFTAAFFTPNIVIDARGVVSTLSQEDWNGLRDLAQRASGELPQTGNFRNQWRIRQARTGFPIDWLRVATSQEGDLKDVSVYGFDGRTAELESPVGEFTQLPPVLSELFGLMKEARDGYTRGEANSDIINRVKSVLPEA